MTGKALLVVATARTPQTDSPPDQGGGLRCHLHAANQHFAAIENHRSAGSTNWVGNSAIKHPHERLLRLHYRRLLLQSMGAVIATLGATVVPLGALGQHAPSMNTNTNTNTNAKPNPRPCCQSQHASQPNAGPAIARGVRDHTPAEQRTLAKLLVVH